MARTVLLVGAVGWLLTALAGIGVAAIGIDDLRAALPPLAIDADALGGAIIAVAIALLAIGGAHVAVLLGGRRRWAISAGALLASVLSILSLALAAAGFASAAREPALAWPLLGAAVLASLMAAGYGMAAVRLARQLGSGSAF
ncbi:MAG TPA: hypothetical protein VF364_06275 [Candidatus Limnocylindria bacterium]